MIIQPQLFEVLSLFRLPLIHASLYNHITLSLCLEYGHHYTGSGTCWIANSQDWNTPPMKEFPLAPKKFATLVLPSTFIDMRWLQAYHPIQKQSPISQK